MTEVRDLAELHVRSFNERAWHLAPELYAPDLAVVQPDGSSQGVDAFLRHAQGMATAFPDSRMEITTIVESDGRAVVEGCYQGTHTGPMATPQGEVPPTGRPLSLPICIVFEAAAGRITSLHPYYDQMTLATQLGLVPAAV
ncbi:MAG TPA: ester cyclase [Actinokineospora sp.]|jgi:steroid delta-isomerase-like uncharacterized protein|nr:ester cyclase [Actinokineospora sp.]